MPFTGEPVNSATDRIRLYVGDTLPYEEGLSDEVYEWIISETSSEQAAAIQALKLLVAKYANYVTEKAGGLFVKESEKYEQYSDLLDKWTKDPTTSLLAAGLPYAGGISKEDICKEKEKEDSVTSIFEWDIGGSNEF